VLSRIEDLIYFVFFLIFNQIWGWSLIVGTMRVRFPVRGKEGGVESVPDLPGRGEVESIGDG
jgi:hypothetical protein